MAGRQRKSFDTQQEAVPPKRKGHFYREPDNAAPLGGKFYSQQTEVPGHNEGDFYTRQPSKSKVPEGHFFRDRSVAASPPDLDEEGLGPTGQIPNGGVDKGEPATSAELSAFKDQVKRRSAKVKRQRGRL